MRGNEANRLSREAARSATNKQMDIVERYVAPGFALNVGAMNESIGVLKDRGWTLKLVDVSRHAAETARQTWGFDVAVSRIEDYQGEAQLFDYVRMGHVIEHLADPRIGLQSVARILRPGGVLLLDTDNAGGFRTRVETAIRDLVGEGAAAKFVKAMTGKDLKKKYGRLIPPVHLCIFSERSLRKLLKETGFEVLEFRKPAWGDSVWFPMVGINQGGFAERVFIKIDQLGALFGSGEVLSVLARRTHELAGNSSGHASTPPTG